MVLSDYSDLAVYACDIRLFPVESPDRPAGGTPTKPRKEHKTSHTKTIRTHCAEAADNMGTPSPAYGQLPIPLWTGYACPMDRMRPPCGQAS